MSPKRKRLLSFKSPQSKAKLAPFRKKAAEDLLMAKRAAIGIGKSYSTRIDMVLLSNMSREKKEAALSKLYSRLTEDVFHFEKNIKMYGFSNAQNVLLKRLLERKLNELRTKTHSYPEI